MNKNSKWMALLLIGLLGMGLVGGCGYGFRGTVNNLPPDIKTVHIPVFVNNTTEGGAEVVFANALIYEFTRGGVIGVVSEAEAQGIISGRIKSAAVDSVIYASQTQAVDRRVTVILEVIFRRADNKKILWQNLDMIRYENFRVGGDPNQTDRNREEALRKISKDLAERIYSGILENF
jgi:outer membrane lipopolysaccharide assembly protein LptE/RlpB